MWQITTILSNQDELAKETAAAEPEFMKVSFKNVNVIEFIVF